MAILTILYFKSSVGIKGKRKLAKQTVTEEKEKKFCQRSET